MIRNIEFQANRSNDRTLSSSANQSSPAVGIGRRTTVARLLRAAPAFLLLVVAALMTLGCSAPPSDESGTSPARLRVAFIVKSTTDPFWLHAIRGGRRAAEGLNIDLEVLSPIDEANIAEQVAMVEDVVQKGVDGIVLAPVDSDALVGSVERANEAGIPVAAIDVGVNGGKLLTLTATDNIRASIMAADRLAESLGGSGKVAALICKQTISSCRKMLVAFEKRLQDHPGLELVAAPVAVPYCEKAYNATTDLITAHPDLRGLFVFGGQANTCAPEAAMAVGKNPGKDLWIVARNAGEQELEAIQTGRLDATVAQFPENMGFAGVQSIADFHLGKPVPSFIHSGTELVTADNVEQYLSENSSSR